MISPQIKTKILQVVNVFETGSLNGKYDSVVRHYDGPGRIKQITYGRSQTTEYGNLGRLISNYIEMGGLFANDFRQYSGKIGKTALTENRVFISLLRKAAREDSIMCKCQDVFFDSYYYQPALIWFRGFGFNEPLSLLVIYDSFIHSGSIRKDLRQKFPERPPINGGNEHVWITQYVEARHQWLINHGNKLLHNTVYRTNCFKHLISTDNWKLNKGFLVNGITVN